MSKGKMILRRAVAVSAIVLFAASSSLAFDLSRFSFDPPELQDPIEDLRINAQQMQPVQPESTQGPTTVVGSTTNQETTSASLNSRIERLRAKFALFSLFF